MTDKLDFSMIIASAVHDMKNSLGMLLHSIEGLRDDLPPEQASGEKMTTLQYEAERVHGDLVQLLGLYRLQESTLAPAIDEHLVSDFLAEVAARYEGLTSGRHIRLTIDCDSALTGYFDRELIMGVIGNTINNAIRYTRSEILVRASAHQQQLMIEVADDGDGYPNSMLGTNAVTAGNLSFDTGSTKLGLYFAARIADLHRQGANHGSIELTNGAPLGGGVFRLRLP